MDSENRRLRQFGARWVFTAVVVHQSALVLVYLPAAVFLGRLGKDLRIAYRGV